MPARSVQLRWKTPTQIRFETKRPLRSGTAVVISLPSFDVTALYVRVLRKGIGTRLWGLSLGAAADRPILLLCAQANRSLADGSILETEAV
jgi:hypothetical protein